MGRWSCTTWLLLIGVLLIMLSVIYRFTIDSTKIDRGSIESKSLIQVVRGPLVSLLNWTKKSFRSQAGGVGKIHYKVPVLMYHYVREVDQTVDQLGYRLSVTPAEFEKQLAAFQQESWQTTTLASLAGTSNHKNLIVLTFDDGYADFYTTAWPILKRYKMRATIFVIASKLKTKDEGYLTSTQVSELAAKGIEVGSHGVDHINLVNQDQEKLVDQLAGSKKVLEDLLGQRIDIISYPSGKYNENVLIEASRAGYRVGVTTDSGVADQDHNLLSLPRVRINGGESVEEVVERIKRMTGED